MYPESWARFAALLMFFGFNLTFFPQFIAGYLGMPRRYYAYPTRNAGRRSRPRPRRRP
jgi:cytochrome c oxidase subunit 1